MKSKTTLISRLSFSILLMLFSIGGQAQRINTVIPFTETGNSQKIYSPQLLIHNSDDNSIEIEYNIENAVVAHKQVNGVDYQYINIKDFDFMDEVGNPAIPSHIDVIVLPDGAKAKISVESAEYIEYSGYNLHPTLELASDSIGAPEPVFKLNQTQYNKNEFFPLQLVKLVEFQTMREAGLAFVELRPVQFNSQTQTIRVYSKIRYRVTYVGAANTFDALAQNNNLNYLNVLNNIALNENVLPRTPVLTQTKSGNNYNYIIITHPDYDNAARDLAKWKMQLGYKVEIISSSGWTSSDIKDSLDIRYTNYSPKPDYVVFIGDVDKVPAEIVTHNNGSVFATDLYYVCMDGSSDYVADMARGRISVSNSNEANIAVQKIINYEKTPVSDPSFYKLGLNCAEFQDNNDNGYADRRFSLTSENIYDYMNGQQSFSIERVYGSTSTNPTNWNNGSYAGGEPIPNYLLKPGFAWDGTGADVRDQINQGQLYVLHRDHGNSQGWGTPGFNTSYIPSLNNGNRLPVMFSINCSSGALLNTACFAEQMLRHSDGGSVGIVAASAVSYSGLNDAFALGLFDAIWADPGLIPNFTGSGGTGNTPASHSKITTLGYVLNQALIRMSETWNSSKITNELFHYHGDPAMKIWTDVPTLITATHPSSLQCGATYISISNASCSDALATVYLAGELIGSTQLVNGNGTIYFDPVTNIDPNVTLTLSKENYAPYIADIPIVNCSFAPITNFNASSTSEIYCGGTINSIVFNDLSQYIPTQWTWTFTPGTVTFINGTNANSQNPEVIFDAVGTYTVELMTSNSYGSDSEVKISYINIHGGNSLPFLEDFENNFSLPNDWTIDNPDSDKTWTLSTNSSGNGSSTASAYINYYSYPSYGEYDALISPITDITNVTNAYLSFYLAYQQFWTYEDSLLIYVSTDCGATFEMDPIYAKGSSDLETVSGTGNFTPNASSHWRQETIDLSAYLGNEVVFKFLGYCGYGNNLYIDDINVYHNTATTINTSVDNNFSVQAFPNPSSGVVNLQIQNLPEDDFSIDVLDALGQKILSKPINSYGNVSETLNLEQYPSGMYFINVYNSTASKFIKLILE